MKIHLESEKGAAQKRKSTGAIKGLHVKELAPVLADWGKQKNLIDLIGAL